jgi:hypothetical protein
MRKEGTSFSNVGARSKRTTRGTVALINGPIDFKEPARRSGDYPMKRSRTAAVICSVRMAERHMRSRRNLTDRVV